MARNVGPSYNHVITANEAQKKFQVDAQTLDKAMSKMSVDLMKDLGADCVNYLRAMSDSLHNLSDRMQESEYKALSAQSSSPQPFAQEWFHDRDTSVYNFDSGHRLPEGFLEKTKQAVKTGLITENQAKAIEYFFHTPQEAKIAHYSPQESQHGGERQGHSQGGGQDQSQNEEENEFEDWQVDFDHPSGKSKQTADYFSTDENPGVSTTLRKGFGNQLSHSTGGNGALSAPPLPPKKKTSSYEKYQSPSSEGMANETAFLNSNFSQDDYAYGMFQSLFGSENWYREFSAKGVTDLQKIHDAKAQIMAELSGIDATTPAGAKKLYLLQQKLGDVQQSEREIMENISRAHQANNERKEYMKSILDIFNQTLSNTIRNLKSG